MERELTPESPGSFYISLAFKKKACPRTRISCLQALQYLLYAPSRLKQSFRYFSFHDELLQVFISRKDGIPPPPVALSWDSAHLPPESVRTEVRTYAVARAKISQINRLPNLLTHGAPRAPLLISFIFLGQ